MATDVTVLVQDASNSVVLEDTSVVSVSLTDEQLVVVEDQITHVVSVGEMGPQGLPASPWCIFRNSILLGETVVVPSNSFMLGVESFQIDGSLDNNGRVLIL